MFSSASLSAFRSADSPFPPAAVLVGHAGTHDIYLFRGLLLSLVSDKTLKAVHDGLFPEDERVAVGAFGKGRLAHVHKDVPGAFHPVEEGVNFDAPSEIWSGETGGGGTKIKEVSENYLLNLRVSTIPAATSLHACGMIKRKFPFRHTHISHAPHSSARPRWTLSNSPSNLTSPPAFISGLRPMPENMEKKRRWRSSGKLRWNSRTMMPVMLVTRRIACGMSGVCSLSVFPKIPLISRFVLGYM